MESLTYPVPGSLGDQVYSSRESELTARFDARLPSVRAAMTSWFSQEHGAAIHAMFRPPLEYPTAAIFSVFWSEEESLSDVLVRFGFPLPEMDPSFVIGRSVGGGTRTTFYQPGPAGLALLDYSAQVGETRLLTIRSERPPEPEFSEQVARYKRERYWKGTLYFVDEAQLKSLKPTEHYPPGDPRARSIV